MSGSFPQVENLAPAVVQPANPPLSAVPSTQNALLPESPSTSVAALLTSGGAAECCSPQPAQLVSEKPPEIYNYTGNVIKISFIFFVHLNCNISYVNSIIHRHKKMHGLKLAIPALFIECILHQKQLEFALIFNLVKVER